jgi:hypothetical protein
MRNLIIEIDGTSVSNQMERRQDERQGIASEG